MTALQQTLHIPRVHKRTLCADVTYHPQKKAQPLIIFCHGYKGFKDWGAWNLMAKAFGEAGYCFLKFNFSYNGGTLEQPIDFPDLESFGQNNYSKELEDLNDVISWVIGHFAQDPRVDTRSLHLIGHSRGGGIVLLQAARDPRINKVITLAGVSDFKSRFPKGEALKAWKEKGVYYVVNGRTKQEMPHYYQFYEDFIANENRLNIQSATRQLKIPHLIIHGNQDTSVPLRHAEDLTPVESKQPAGNH